jgi:cytochrome oxidase assembly protein ShyY1
MVHLSRRGGKGPKVQNGPPSSVAPGRSGGIDCDPTATRHRSFAVVLLALVVAAVCVRLGVWQLDRLEQRRARNEAIRTGLAAPPHELATAPDGDAYRRATASGTYDGSRTLVLYGRSLGGAPGIHVLTPLRLPDGTAVLVDRGWVPSSGETEDVPLPPTPAGEVRVTGVLLPREPGGTLDGRTVDRVDLRMIEVSFPYRLGGAYLLLREQVPPADAPVAAPLPELTDGPHLSYAIQWFSFAAVALAGGVVLARRTPRRPTD